MPARIFANYFNLDLYSQYDSRYLYVLTVTVSTANLLLGTHRGTGTHRYVSVSYRKGMYYAMHVVHNNNVRE